MKKTLFAVAAAYFLAAPYSFASEFLTLVHSEFSGKKWYCTYKIQGTSYEETITSEKPCQQAIVR